MGKRNKSVYREAFDGILQIYLFKVKQQEQREHQFNILLVLAGVLSVVLFNLYTETVVGSKPWWITAIPLIGVYIISIYHVFPKRNLKPWISKDDYEKIVKEEKPASQMYKELNISMYFLVPEEKDKKDEHDRKYITCAIFLIVAVFASLSINLLWNTLFEIYSITTVIFIGLSILFYYAFTQSEKKMIKARDAINKRVEKYMKTEKNE